MTTLVLAAVACVSLSAMLALAWRRRAIVARKELEAALRRFDALFDSLPQLACISDRDGTCERVNALWTEFTGLPDATGGAQPWWTALSPEDRDAARTGWSRALAEGSEFQAEVRVLRSSDGAALWHLVRASRTSARGAAAERWLVTFVDIQARRQAEVALREREQRLARIVETVAEGLFIIDAQGRIVFANAMAEKLVGLTRSSITERSHDDARWTLSSIDGAPIASDDLPAARVLRTGESVFDVQLSIRRPDGETVLLSVNAAALRDADERVTGVVASVSDITRRKEVERLKDALVSTVSHELRTPLSSLIGFTELMLSREYAREKRREFLTIIHTESKRLAHLVNDLLDVQRMESGRCSYAMRLVDLRPLLDSLPELFAGQHAGARVQVERVQTPLFVMADLERLRQALVNLVSNALKFSAASEPVRVCARAAHGEVCVSVVDRGAGIPPEALPKLFHKFFRVENRETRGIAGTGLGLSIVKEIVAAHGGRVWAESALGRGSSFHIALAETSPPRSARVRSAGPELADVVVVEDDAAYSQLLIEQLRSDGLSVCCVRSGEEALERVWSSIPRLVLLDVQLAGFLDGWDVLVALKSDPRLEHVPVLLLTASDAANPRGLALAGCELAPKPLDPERLLGAIRAQRGTLEGARVLVIDDDENFRKHVREVLAARQGIEVLEAFDGDDALRVLAHSRPDLVLLDLLMPRVDGFEVLRRMRSDRNSLQLPVLVTTAKQLSARERAFLQRSMATLVRKQDASLDHVLGEVQGLLSVSAADLAH